MSAILMENIDIITMNADSEIIQNGFIYIKDNMIKSMGKMNDLTDKLRFECDQIISNSRGKRLIAVPGFIQTHVHTSQALGRGLADDVDIITWTRKRIWPYESALTEDDVYISAMLCMAQMVKSGTTMFCEASGQFPDAIAQAVIDSGIKGTICLSTMDLPGDIPENLRMSTSEAIDLNKKLIQKWSNKHNRVDACFNILNMFLSSETLWKELSQTAREENILLQTHLAETPSEIAFVKEKHGLSTIKYLDKLGVLGDHVLAAHVVHIDDEELDILSKRKVNVLHCPATGLRLAGIARLQNMLDKDIPVSLGINSPPCSNRMSMLDEMWLAGIMHKGVDDNPEAVPAESVMKMATVNAAGTLKKSDKTGSIESGKLADITLLDFNNIVTTPSYDYMSTIIYQANDANVHTVISEGEILLENGTLSNVDESWLIWEAERRAKAIMKKVWRDEKSCLSFRRNER